MAYKPQARGAQQPEKYPFVGEQYSYWGEQPGFIYNPYNDTYMIDQRAAEQYYQQAGVLGTPEGVPAGATPGPKQPQKYPRTGPNYDRYGEIPGTVYDPASDTYVTDPQALQTYYESVGLAEPEPSLMDQYGPIVGTGLSLGLASGLAQNPTGFIGGIKDGASGLFGLGNATASAAPTAAAAPAATTAAAATAPATPSLIGASAGGGTFGLGGSAAAAAPATPEIVGAGATTPGTFGISAASALPAAAVLYGGYRGYQMYDHIAGSDKGVSGGIKEGLKPANMLAFGLTGAPMLGGLMGGVNDFFGGDGDKWKEESNRLSDLRDDGTFIPDEIFNTMPTQGRSKDELRNQSVAADYIGFDPSGNWTNNKFNDSRDLKDLRPEDIVGYATWAERDPLWFEKPLQERLNVANAALQANAVSEHNGTIDVDFEKFDPGAAPASYSGYSGNPSLPSTPAPLPAAATTPKPQPTPAAPAPGPKPGPQKDPFWMFRK